MADQKLIANKMADYQQKSDNREIQKLTKTTIVQIGTAVLLGTGIVAEMVDRTDMRKHKRTAGATQIVGYNIKWLLLLCLGIDVK